MKRKGAGLGTRVELQQQALVPVRKKTRRTKPARARQDQHDSERSCPLPAERPILDERIPGLFFDSLASVQAAIISASNHVPYSTLRQAMALDPQEKTKLTSAAQAVAAKHPAFFDQHKDVLEFVIGLMAFPRGADRSPVLAPRSIRRFACAGSAWPAGGARLLST